jgi:hypothetical protein
VRIWCVGHGLPKATDNKRKYSESQPALTGIARRLLAALVCLHRPTEPVELLAFGE